MNLKIIFLTFIAILLFFVPVEASEGVITVDAGLIEWGGSYVKATEGFQLDYQGKKITGTELFYDTVTGEYLIDELAFRACVNDAPHYRILAGRLEIYPGEKLVFSRAKVEVWGTVIPLPSRLVLKYEDGSYRFPEWLPEVFYTAEEGLGLRFNWDYEIVRSLSLSGSAALGTKGKPVLSVSSSYEPLHNLIFTGVVQYQNSWSGGLSADWRKGQSGFQSSLSWSKSEERGEEWGSLFGYKYKGWQARLTLRQKPGEKLLPLLEVNTPETRFAGISQNMLFGVTTITEKDTKISHDKVNISSNLYAGYSLGKAALKLTIAPTVTWLENYGYAVSNNFNAEMSLSAAKLVTTRVGYGRTDRAGVKFPLELDDYKRVEYVKAGLAVGYRNGLDEGWDVDISGQFSLVDEKVEFIRTNIVKAYDCFDLTGEIEWVNPAFKLGITLKY